MNIQSKVVRNKHASLNTVRSDNSDINQFLEGSPRSPLQNKQVFTKRRNSLASDQTRELLQTDTSRYNIGVQASIVQMEL